MVTLTSQSQRTQHRAGTRSVILLKTHNKNFEPHAPRFISLHRVVIKQVRKRTYNATILSNSLLLPAGIQFVQHVFHSSVQLVFEISLPRPHINIQLVTLTITRTNESVNQNFGDNTQLQISKKKSSGGSRADSCGGSNRRITTALLCAMTRCDIQIKGGIGQ
jgi:hypothetical protein